MSNETNRPDPAQIKIMNDSVAAGIKCGQEIAALTEANSSPFLPVSTPLAVTLLKDIPDACLELSMCRERKWDNWSEEQFAVRAQEQTARARSLMRQFLDLTDPVDSPDPKEQEAPQEPDWMALAKDQQLESEEDAMREAEEN